MKITHCPICAFISVRRFILSDNDLRMRGLLIVYCCALAIASAWGVKLGFDFIESARGAWLWCSTVLIGAATALHLMGRAT